MKINVLIFAMALWVLALSGQAPGADPAGSAGTSGSSGSETDDLLKFATKFGEAVTNHHMEIACKSCHKTIPEDTAMGKVLESLVDKPSVLCKRCHPTYANIHPSDREPSMKTPEILPLDGQGHITCTTCHRVHDPSAEFSLLRGFLDGEFQHRRDLCFACHGTNFAELNPHRAESGKKRCTYCHIEVPSSTDTADTVTFRLDVSRMCNFCHDMQSRFHPLNVDPNIQVPAGLPRGGTGSLHCGTCHNPHGTSETVHFLRREYVNSVQTSSGRAHGDNPDCNACHVGKPVSGAPLKFRYGGNITILCNSCHGTSTDIHPVDIRVPRGLRKPTDLPLSPESRITCLTCHEIRCREFGPQKPEDVSLGSVLGGDRKAVEAFLAEPKAFVESESTIVTRFFNRQQGQNDLCFKCHPEEQFRGFSPHMGIDYRKMEYIEPKFCRFCHDIDPSRGAGTVEQVSFISNPRMICIRCHPERPHPAGREHMIRPIRVKVPQDLPLDMDGKISCSTCHDPHASNVGTIKTRAESQQQLCTMCHVK